MKLENFSFANPNAGLILLALVPIYYWFIKQDKYFDCLIDSTLSPLMRKLRASTKFKTSNTGISTLMLGMLLITIAMMRPRWGYEIIDTNYKGVDIAIAVDVSDSMLAEDINPNRLGVAKRKVIDIIKETPQDRIALISSAGTAFIESPLTLDKSSIELLSSTLQPDLAPLKGSSLSSAIEASHKAFSRGISIGSTSRASALILLTDGEFDSDDLEYSKALLKDYNITPYAIIFGTAQGAPIPTGNGFKRDSAGKIVVSKANIDDISSLFKEFKGKVIQSDPGLGDVIEIVNRGIEKDLKKEVINYKNTKNQKEYFQYPLMIGLILVLLTWRKPLKVSIQIIVFLSILFRIGISQAEPVQIIKQAQSELEKGNFENAINIINQVEQNQETHSSTLLKGNILYRLGEFSLSEKEFAKSASLAKTAKEKSASLFNRGNSLLQAGKFKDAKEDYELAQRDNPTDQEIENNLKYVKKLLEEPPTEDEKQKEDPPPQEEEKKEEKNSQNNNETKDQESQEPSQPPPGGNSTDQNQTPQKEEKQESQNESSSPITPEDQSSKSSESKQDQPQLSDSNNSESNNEAGQSSVNRIQEEALSDQTMSQLGSLEEDTTSRQKYRYQKALKELESSSKHVPRRDW